MMTIQFKNEQLIARIDRLKETLARFNTLQLVGETNSSPSINTAISSIEDLQQMMKNLQNKLFSTQTEDGTIIVFPERNPSNK